MKAFLFLSLAVISVAAEVSAGDINTGDIVNKDIRRNLFYFELLGHGVFYSLNYDRVLPLKKSEILFLRIGAASATEKDSHIHPGMVTEIRMLSGGERHFFDAGSGYPQFPGFPDKLVSWEEVIVSWDLKVFSSGLLRCIYLTPKKEIHFIIASILGYRLAIRFNDHFY